MDYTHWKIQKFADSSRYGVWERSGAPDLGVPFGWTYRGAGDRTEAADLLYGICGMHKSDSDFLFALADGSPGTAFVYKAGAGDIFRGSENGPLVARWYSAEELAAGKRA